jgi:MFS transporter, DHA2 family, methylenomycin A resistance protein
LAFNTGPAVGLAISAMPLTRAGLASGVVNIARPVGITVGVAALGTVMALDGVRTALLAGGVVELLGAGAVLQRMAGERASAPEDEEVCYA